MVHGEHLQPVLRAWRVHIHVALVRRTLLLVPVGSSSAPRRETPRLPMPSLYLTSAA
jgi:hypothetical protein